MMNGGEVSPSLPLDCTVLDAATSVFPVVSTSMVHTVCHHHRYHCTCIEANPPVAGKGNRLGWQAIKTEIMLSIAGQYIATREQCSQLLSRYHE